MEELIQSIIDLTYSYVGIEYDNFNYSADKSLNNEEDLKDEIKELICKFGINEAKKQISEKLH